MYSYQMKNILADMLLKCRQRKVEKKNEKGVEAENGTERDKAREIILEIGKKIKQALPIFFLFLFFFFGSPFG